MKRHQHKILIPAVIVIWLMVIARFAGNLWAEADPVEMDTSKAISWNFPNIDRDSLTLWGDYRDPFLSKSPSRLKQSSSRQAKPVVRKRIVQKKPSVKLPQLRFKGIVAGTQADQHTGILQMNGKSYHVRQGDSIEGAYVLSLQQKALFVQIADSTIRLGL